MQDETELPLPDYDELPVAALEHRIHALSADQIRRLIEHEHRHGDRLPVLTVLRGRLDALAHGARPSDGDQSASGKPAATAHGSPVSPDSAGEPDRPLRHGVAGQTPKPGRPS